MLTISTIAEALAELEKQTGRAWTDSELFDVATNRGVELHAAPPITAQTTIQKFVNGKGLVEKFRSEPGHAALAVLFPAQVGQLWITGETLTSHPNKHDEIEGEYQWFTEPVRVTREQVRIKAESLKKVVDAWHKAQAGRRIKDEKQPGDMRWQHPPDWMFPTEPQPAQAQTAATPAPVVAASDGPAPLPAVPNWKMRVQAEAAELFLRLLASGANPTPHSLVEPMAKWCRDNEVKTDTGINPSEGYLRTHVLGGRHWTAPTMTREQAKKHVAQVAQVAQTKVAQVAQC